MNMIIDQLISSLILKAVFRLSLIDFVSLLTLTLSLTFCDFVR